MDDHVQWLKSRPNYRPEMETEYRDAKSSEQVRVAEDLRELDKMAGVLLVDAQGHGIISAKIASTVHDTFHAFMLSELDHHGKTTPELFENINLRLAQSVTARNALGISDKEHAREIATMVVSRAARCGIMRSNPSAQNEQLLQASFQSGANITCCTTSWLRPLNRSPSDTLPSGPSNT